MSFGRVTISSKEAVEPLQDYAVDERHRANTARYLALALVAILGLSIVLQYTSTMILIYTGKADAISNLDKCLIF